MPEQFAIPKVKVVVEVFGPGWLSTPVTLFLSDLAETHAGQERPSDLLNGTRAFIPVVDAGGSLLLLNRDTVTILTVPAEHEPSEVTNGWVESGAGEGSIFRVEVTMLDGSKLQGDVRYIMPVAQRRLQDFMNSSERFLALRRDEVVHLVNKRRIARVAVL